MANYFRGNLFKNRVWVPKNIQKPLQNNFCEFSIKYNKSRIKFISKLSKDGRLVIPKNLCVEKNARIKVNFIPIRNSVRPKSILRSLKIDILSLIPKTTLTNFEILAVPKNNSIFVWYFASKGRPNSIVINRFLGSNFCRLLGYYRAEGGKPRISKRRGREFSFTNKSIYVITDFINLFGALANINMLKASIAYNPSSAKKLNKIKLHLVKLGVKKLSIRFRKVERVKEYTIRLYVTNSLLSEIIDKAEVTLRKFILVSKNKNLCVEYLRGVIEGDGSLHSWRDKKGSLHSRLQIFEPNKIALDEINKMLELLGIYGKISKAKTQMYIYSAYLNWNNLLYVYENNLANSKTNKIRSAIITHKRFNSMKHFLILPKKFNTSQFRILTKKSYGYSATWLKDREKEGLVKRIVKENNQNVWVLDGSAKSLISVLQNVKKSS
ncbi:MAG TPA: hypothetical protein VJH04_02920 [archaeon]|nr:hypothetical protein [archaeon]